MGKIECFGVRRTLGHAYEQCMMCDLEAYMQLCICSNRMQGSLQQVGISTQDTCLHTLLKKSESDNPAYSSSGGRSSSLSRYQLAVPEYQADTYPSRTLLADTGPLPVFPTFAGSPSAETLNRSSTSPVFIDPSPAFCCVTTELAISNLNRCNLFPHQPFPLPLPGNGSASPHDLLFECPSHDQSIYVHDLLLPQSMRPVHRLQILHGVPIVIHEDHRVRSCQIQSQTADTGCEEQDIDARVVVEPLDDSMALSRIGGTVHPHVGHGRHELGEQIPLDQVEHRTQLAENKGAMLGILLDIPFVLIGCTDTAVSKKLAVEDQPTAKYC